MDPCAPVNLLDYPAYGAAFSDYLNNRSRLVVVLMARDLTILGCNRGFIDMLRRKEEPVGSSLRDFLSEESRQKKIRPEEGVPRETRLAFVGSEGGHQILVCHLFPAEHRLLLFGESIMATESQLLQQVSGLNRQLADLVRKVRSKNRELERANARIGELVRTDSLTGIANRRGLGERLDRELSLAQRHGQDLTLVMADLDHFKRVNDTFGHAAGDQVLKAFATLLGKSCRKEDFVARFGGEEFVVLLPLTGEEGALRFAEHVRRAWEATEVADLKGHFTASFGVARHGPGETADDLFRRADAALYRAKEKGRNRVEAGEPAESGASEAD